MNMRDIIVNGERFSIRDNLWRFLRRARAQNIQHIEVPEPHEEASSNSTPEVESLGRDKTPAVYKPGFLWIDQICIDQNSMLEKSEQVSSMADIYTRSQRTVVWLGDETEHSVANLTFMVHWGHAARRTQLLQGVEEETRIAEHARFAKAHESQIDAAREFFMLKYWARLWVVQEFALGPDIAIIWGSRLATWYDLAYLIEALLVGFDILGDYVTEASTTLGLRYVLATRFPKYSLALYSALLQFAHRHCAISVDRVFGLQAFIRPVDRIEIDYTRPAHEVFWTALSKAITSELAAGSKELCRPSEVLSFFRLGVAMGVTAENIDLDNAAVRHCVDAVFYGNDVVWMFSNVKKTESRLYIWFEEWHGRDEFPPFELDTELTCDQNQAQAEEERQPKRVCGTRCEVM